MKKSIALFLALVVALTMGLVPAAPAAADSAVVGYVGHYYQLIGAPTQDATGVTWTAARAAAAAMTYSDGTVTYYGHLATINSAAENNFVYTTFLKGFWSGSDGRGWIGGFQLNNQASTSAGWNWVTGESFSYTNWDTDYSSPNDAVKGGTGGTVWTPGIEDNGENFMEMRGNGKWDDLGDYVTEGYIVEFEPVLVLNGSFEKPALADNIPGGGTLGWFTDPLVTDWNSSPSPGFEIQRAYFTTGAHIGDKLALDGYQFAELDSNNFNASIWQNVPTASGRTYLLQFSWAARPGHPENNQIQVLWNGNLFFTTPTVPDADAPEGSITWHEQNFFVKGAGATTELKFTQLGWWDGLGTYLDKIKVVPVENPIVTFSLTPAVDFNPVGTSHVVELATTPATPGLVVNFTVTGANAVGPTGGVTGGDGKVTFGYTSTKSGKDTITAAFGEVTTSVTKYWLGNYVTGGGSVKTNKTSFAGMVGIADGVGIVGQFQFTTHGNKGTTVTWTCVNNFSALQFNNTPIIGPQGPDASANTATFTGTFTPDNGEPTAPYTITIVDASEGGAKQDTIMITPTIIPTATIIDTGNFQLHNQ